MFPQSAFVTDEIDDQGMARVVSLAKVASKLENVWDAVRWRDPNPNPVIEPYIGYSTQDEIVLRGRILSDKRRSQQARTPSLFNNMRAMAMNFATDELADMRVQAAGVETRSDEEGYFTLRLPPKNVGGMATITLPDHDVDATAIVQVASADAQFGIISDIDDTIMQTDAWALHRNIWTTLTGSAASRHVFPDSIALIEKLHAGKNPVFYVSSSPWNLHAFLTDVFRRNGLISGPLFLRDLGITETKFIKGTHGAHKGSAIDTILAANPTLNFVLIGDTGQHDAVVYHEAIVRHPNCIDRVILRRAGPPDEDDAHNIDIIRQAGVRCDVAADFHDIF